jgi:D-alanine-D-alanine ligase
VRKHIAVIYNQPSFSRYSLAGEEAAVTGVLEAVEAVYFALQELDYAVIRVPLALPIEQAEEQLHRLDADLVFNLFEGFCGYPETEADIADILLASGIPFTGSPGEALRLALDKAKTSAVLRANGINTPDFRLLDVGSTSTFNLRYPCIVKPPAEDASHGISERSIVYNTASLKEQVAFINNTYGSRALVQEFIDGREFNITIMGNNSGYTALPVSEIEYSLPEDKPRILTFDAKWKPGSLYFKGARVVCPAEIDDKEHRRIEETAITAFGFMSCCGYARVDMRLDGTGELCVIEVNPNPDISPGSGVVRQAEAAGLTYIQLIERIAQLAPRKEGSETKDTADAKRR